MKQAARAQLNTIHQHISKAVTDSKISDEEFALIIDELDGTVL